MMDIIHSNSYFNYCNCIVLSDDLWDDFSYRTTFNMSYYDKNGDRYMIGIVKIYYSGYDNDITKSSFYFIKSTAEVIGSSITQLDGNFCSLGQDLNYYINLKRLCPNNYINILRRLNDIAIDERLEKDFHGKKGVLTSLLRNSSAEKALKEARNILEDEQLNTVKNLSFEYNTKVPYSEGRVKLKFDFEKNSCLPYRINVLIGKNGVGKTQILAHLAETLSGITTSETEIKDSFPNDRPLINKIISISYSAFDEFRKRKADNNDYQDISYAYCGIHSGDRTMSLIELKDNFKKSFGVILEKNRLSSWKKVMYELIEKEIIDLIERNIDEIDNIHFSSGQYILLCTMTEVMATIENESLLLFDEPELHLHPNAIASTMRMFYKLLEEFNSYAIFATHSPLIVQETPTRYIHVLSRIDNVLIARKPTMECFGENITNITDDIFDVNSSESNYKVILKNLSEKYSFNQVLKVFNEQLSLNALIYLKACYEYDEKFE